MKKFFIVLIATLVAFVYSLNAQNNLVVKVNNLNDSEGTLMIALFDSQATFLSPQVKKAQAVTITGTTAEVTFSDIANGEYAIALYQDSNNNRDLDLGKYGIPTEKYGFSNNINPAIVRGVPTFSACKFEVVSNSEIEIVAVSAISK